MLGRGSVSLLCLLMLLPPCVLLLDRPDSYAPRSAMDSDWKRAWRGRNEWGYKGCVRSLREQQKC